MDFIHLNHAGIAPWPRRTVDAVQRFAQDNLEGARDPARWAATEHALREQLKDLINAQSTAQIALVSSTSAGLSTVAYGLDWRRGDNVVLARQEFPSNRIVWQSLNTRFGVEARLVDLDQKAIPEEALLTACDAQTRLLAVSAVQYASGLKMDLMRLGEACRRRGIHFCVDAIQALGAMPFDAQAIHADFVVADGHKWLLAPEGLALFYCREPDQLRLTRFGWHMQADFTDFERLDWAPASSARRFEAGSLNQLGIHALNASLSFLLETGLDKIRTAITERVAYLDEATNALGLARVTPAAPDRRAGILTVRCPGQDAKTIHQGLETEGIRCALRAGGVRFSPHFYTPMAALDRTLEFLKSLRQA